MSIEINTLFLPLSSDRANKIVGKMRKTMYHESRSRIVPMYFYFIFLSQICKEKNENKNEK